MHLDMEDGGWMMDDDSASVVNYVIIELLENMARFTRNYVV